MIRPHGRVGGDTTSTSPYWTGRHRALHHGIGVVVTILVRLVCPRTLVQRDLTMLQSYGRMYPRRECRIAGACMAAGLVQGAHRHKIHTSPGSCDGSRQPLLRSSILPGKDHQPMQHMSLHRRPLQGNCHRRNGLVIHIRNKPGRRHRSFHNACGLSCTRDLIARSHTQTRNYRHSWGRRRSPALAAALAPALAPALAAVPLQFLE